MSLGWIAGGAIAGAIIGSFLATLVIRWPAGRDLGGRSKCDMCSRTLRPLELVPLLSFVAQRGRCRHCSAAIDPSHPAIELTCLIVGAAALAVAPGWEGAAGALFGWLLVALAALDVGHFWLPDRLTLPLAALGLVSGAIGLKPDLASRLIGGAAGFAVLALVALGYRLWRGREGMGQGDPKLLGAIGLWLGWMPLPFVMLGAASVGLGVALSMRLRGQTVAADTRLPLGALMAVAAFPAWLLSR